MGASMSSASNTMASVERRGSAEEEVTGTAYGVDRP
jgi:hypothetical protein